MTTMNKLGRTVTKGIHRMSPATSLQIAKRFFLSPKGRRNYELQTEVKPREFKLATTVGDIHGHFFLGNDKHILLTHGWADNSTRFIPLIDELVEQGYSVWVFDHIGHGKSDGSTSHLFNYIIGLESMISHIELQGHRIEAIVSHSLGGAAVLNLDQEILDDIKVIMVGTPVKIFEAMFNKTTKAGVSAEVLKFMLDELSRDFNRNWQTCAPLENKHKIAENFLFVHDPEDRFASFTNLELLIANTTAKVHKTNELGHAKLLRHSETVKIMRRFIDSENN